MAQLTREQMDFLREQNIPMGLMFDASGMRTAQYKAAMRLEGKAFAYGVTRCGAGGHSLRTRAGHCIQCDTSKIAYMMRHDQPGHVYIAGSLAGRLLKVGTTIDLADRLNKLNEYRYGGVADWQILASVHVASAGRIESAVKNSLSIYHVPGDYIRAVNVQSCYELYQCNLETVVETLAQFSGKGARISGDRLDALKPHYAFAR